MSPFFRRAALVLALFAAAVLAAAQSGPSAADILAAIDAALFLDSYASRATMATVDAAGKTVSLSFDGLSRKDKGTYMEVTAPARTKGSRFLQLDGSLWLYNPKAGAAAAIRLSARDSFQGSTFANADVGKSQFADDYTPSRAPDAELDHPELGKVPCYVIESVARDETAAYGKIVMWARKSDSMPLQMEYYAKSCLLYKRMVLSAIKDFGPIRRPSVLRMESLEKAGTITTLTLEWIERRDVPLSVFNKAYLTR
jgi:outer membrane lipoprotein-sorting protein